MALTVTERARRIGRTVVAARYRSERERGAIMAGKQDDNPNVKDATLAAQVMMNELMPVITIAEIALDQNNIALLEISAADIRNARKET